MPTKISVKDLTEKTLAAAGNGARPNSELKAVVAILASPVVAAFATKLGEMALARLANLERRDEERHQQALLEGKAHVEATRGEAGRVEDERLEKRIHLLRNSEGLPRAVTLALEDWVVKAL